jgi:hypothetical protein
LAGLSDIAVNDPPLDTTKLSLMPNVFVDGVNDAETPLLVCILNAPEISRVSRVITGPLKVDIPDAVKFVDNDPVGPIMGILLTKIVPRLLRGAEIVCPPIVITPPSIRLDNIIPVVLGFPIRILSV